MHIQNKVLTLLALWQVLHCWPQIIVGIGYGVPQDLPAALPHPYKNIYKLSKTHTSNGTGVKEHSQFTGCFITGLAASFHVQIMINLICMCKGRSVVTNDLSELFVTCIYPNSHKEGQYQLLTGLQG